MALKFLSGAVADRPGVVERFNKGEMKSVSSLRPDLPVGIDDWFTHVLSRDVNARFASAR